MPEKIYFKGAISVKAALESGVRDVYAVYADPEKDSRDFGWIIRLAHQKHIPVEMTNRASLDALCGDSNGGIAALVGQRRYASVDDLLSVPEPFLVLLEGVEDPYNYADAVRSAYAAGATGLIVPARAWQNAEDVVVRTSAGASERIPTISADDLGAVLVRLRGAGVRVLAADRKDAVSLYEADLTGPVLLAIGGRLRGLSRAVYENADARVYIPYGRDFRNALTASGATAVMCFEAARKRGLLR